MLTAEVCAGCTPVYALRKQQLFSLLTAIVLISHFFGVHGHGFMTAPRTRGALRCPTRNINPRDIAGDDAPIDYCPMCAHAGSKVRRHGGKLSNYAAVDASGENTDLV